MKYSLRPYQVNAVEQVRSRIKSGFLSPLVVAPTGAGKTVIACNIIERAAARKTRTLFLAHRKELIDQTSAKLDEIGLDDHGVIKAGHWRNRPECAIQIASVQTLNARMARLRMDYNLIIIDEAHHATASSYTTVVEECWKTNKAALQHARKRPLSAKEELNCKPIVLGLTATPYRTDNKSNLADIFDCLVVVTTVPELQEEGFLVRTRVFAGKAPDLRGVGISRGDYDQKALGRIMDQKGLVGDIVAEWQRLGENRTTVVFATTVDHSKHLVEKFKERGVRAEHLDGTMKEERSGVLRRLASGQTTVVCNVEVLTEGWDLPRCSCIVLARPTKSRGLWRQMVGRVLRPAEGKTNAIVLDHAGCTDEHGFITDPDDISLSAGVTASKGDGPTFRCPACKAKLRSWPSFCPACGQELPRGERNQQLVLEVAPGEQLVEREAPAIAPVKSPRNERAEYFRWLVSQALRKGYKAGWVCHRFKGKYGDFPTKADQEGATIVVVFDPVSRSQVYRDTRKKAEQQGWDGLVRT